MASVPVPVQRGISTNIGPAGTNRRPQVFLNPGAASGLEGPARALANLGGATAQLAAQAKRMQSQKDAAGVLDAFTSAQEATRDFLTNKENGIYTRLGGAAEGSSAESKTFFQKVQTDLTSGLNQRQRQPFQKLLETLRQSTLDGVADHELREHQVFVDTSLKNGLQSNIESAIDNFTNPEAAVKFLTIGQGAIDALGPDGSNEIGLAKLMDIRSKFTSDFHLAMVERMQAAGDTRNAIIYFQSHAKMIEVNERIKIAKGLETAGRTDIAQRMADSITNAIVPIQPLVPLASAEDQTGSLGLGGPGTAGTLLVMDNEEVIEGPLTERQAMAEAALIPDVFTRQETEKLIEQHFQDERRFDKQDIEDALTRARLSVERFGTTGFISPSDRRLLQEQGYWANLHIRADDVSDSLVDLTNSQKIIQGMNFKAKHDPRGFMDLTRPGGERDPDSLNADGFITRAQVEEIKNLRGEIDKNGSSSSSEGRITDQNIINSTLSEADGDSPAIFTGKTKKDLKTSVQRLAIAAALEDYNKDFKSRYLREPTTTEKIAAVNIFRRSVDLKDQGDREFETITDVFSGDRAGEFAFFLKALPDADFDEVVVFFRDLQVLRDAGRIEPSRSIEEELEKTINEFKFQIGQKEFRERVAVQRKEDEPRGVLETVAVLPLVGLKGTVQLAGETTGVGTSLLLNTTLDDFISLWDITFGRAFRESLQTAENILNVLHTSTAEVAGRTQAFFEEHSERKRNEPNSLVSLSGLGRKRRRRLSEQRADTGGG